MVNMTVKGVGNILDLAVSTKANVQSDNGSESFSETFKSISAENTSDSQEFDNSRLKLQADSRTDKFNTVNRREKIKSEEEITDEQMAMASEEVISQMKQVLMDKYNISDEQLEAAMNSLGLDEECLLNVADITKLVMKLDGIEDQADMLTNSEFPQNLKEILSKLQETKSNVKVDDVNTFEVMDEKADIMLDVENVSDLSEVIVEDVAEVLQQVEVVEKSVTIDNDTVIEETQLAEQLILEKTTQTGEENSETMLKQDDNKSDVVDTEEMARNTNIQPQDFARKLTEDLTKEVGEVKANDIVRQVVEQTQVQVKQGVTSLEMQLYPEHLGKVLVQVVSHDGSITAQITAESESAKVALESQLTLLKENLNDQGVKVENVEVTIASHAFEQNMQGEASDERGFSHSKRSRKNTDLFFDEVSDEEVEVIDQGIMALKGSTVSYSA